MPAIGPLIAGGVIKANRTLKSAPLPLSASISQATPLVIDILFNQNIDTSYVPSITAFSISGKTGSSVSVSGAIVSVTVTVAFGYRDSSITIGYTQPAVNQLRALAGGAYVSTFSSLSVTNNITHPLAIEDGNTVAWYKPKSAGGETTTARGLVWWDMLVGSSSYGPVINSGTTVNKEVYLIVSCQTNYFYTGCKAGDVFVSAPAGNTLDANNTVRKVLGNHIVQYNMTQAPINQVFDGSNDGMATPSITFTKPAMVYLLLKQKTWTSTDYICDGLDVSESINILQYASTPGLEARGNTLSSQNNNLALDTWGIIRALFKGANSTFQIDDTGVITWNCGSAGNPGGFCLGSRGYAFSNFSNIEVAEVILRSVDESAAANASINNYLKARKAEL